MRDPTNENTSSPECVNLPAEEWLALDHIIFALHDCGTVGNLEDFVLNGLPGKLGADFASWNEHNPEMFLERVENSESHREKIAPLVAALNESLPTHPLFPDYFDFGTGKVVYSDTVDRTRAAVSEEEYRNTDFFLNVADKLGIEDQLVMHVYVRDGRGILLTFHGSREFSQQDLLKASIVRGHVIARLHTLYRETEKLRESRKRITGELDAILSDRERQVTERICTGETNSMIADSLALSTRTVDKHVTNVLRKLELANRYQLISKYAHWLGQDEPA